MGIKKQNRGVHTRRVRAQMHKIYLFQVILVAIVATSLFFLQGKVESLSVVAAGLIYLIPNLYFTQRALKHDPGATAGRVLAQMYMSEIWKMVLTAVLFGAAFVLIKPISAFSLFGTYILMQIIGSIAQATLKNSSRKL